MAMFVRPWEDVKPASTTFSFHNNQMSQMSPVKTEIPSPPPSPQDLWKDTIAKMEEWYWANFSNPYPTEKEIHSYAAMAEVPLRRVKVWFSDKRVKTKNTRVCTCNSDRPALSGSTAMAEAEYRQQLGDAYLAQQYSKCTGRCGRVHRRGQFPPRKHYGKKPSRCLTSTTSRQVQQTAFYPYGLPAISQHRSSALYHQMTSTSLSPPKAASTVDILPLSTNSILNYQCNLTLPCGFYIEITPTNEHELCVKQEEVTVKQERLA